MDKTKIVVSAIVGSFGVLSAILAFSAEGTKLTLADVLVIRDDECYYPPNPAAALALCASVLLLLAQITVAAASGCCKSRSGLSDVRRSVGVICAVVSWISAGIAWGLLIEGASLNANGVRKTVPVCYVLKDGTFAGAALLTLVAAAFGVITYIVVRSQPEEPKAGAGIAMGQPQLPHGYGYGHEHA